MTAAAKSLIHLLAACTFMLLAVGGCNFVVDPLQYFRPAQFFTPVYSADTRVQNAGLIHSQAFDTVLMGTSLAIHFRQSEIDRALGVRSLKLSMTGSNSREQGFVLAAALARQPKRVIWQMDDWIFGDAPEIDADIHLPADLYRRNAKGIGKYLFSLATARDSLLTMAWSVPRLQPLVAWLVPTAISRVDDIHALPPGFDVAGLYNVRAAIDSFRRITDPVRSAYLAENYDAAKMVRNFERDAIGLIEKHPDVQFDIYFPPYSILQFVAMRDASPATLQIVYDVTAHAASRLTQLPNVTLQDFRDIADVTHDLGNYSDVIHHSPAIDAKILSWLAGRQHVVDRAAPLASLERLKAQVEVYRLEP